MLALKNATKRPVHEEECVVGKRLATKRGYKFANGEQANSRDMTQTVMASQ